MYGKGREGRDGEKRRDCGHIYVCKAIFTYRPPFLDRREYVADIMKMKR
jgi:hypothetical protein